LCFEQGSCERQRGVLAGGVGILQGRSSTRNRTH
jgi:hypothetical protein